MGVWKERRALILSAGPCSNLDYVHKFLATAPGCLIICADGGMRYAQQMGLIPDLVVADFDSASEQIECHELIRLKPEKDDTDTQHCIATAIERGCSDITLACATGGRLDHMLSNLLLCETAAASGAKLTVLDNQNTVFLYSGKCMQFTRANARKYISIIPLDSEITGVTLRGVKYPLQDACLSRTRIISISNEVVENNFEIQIMVGHALIIFSEDAP